MSQPMRRSGHLFGLDLRWSRSANRDRRRPRRSASLPQVAAEVSLLEPRCLLSGLGLRPSGVMAHNAFVAHVAHEHRTHSGASTGDFVWPGDHVTVEPHGGGVKAYSISKYWAGKNPWDAIVGLSGFSLDAGSTYRIEVGFFEITNADPNYRVNLQEANPPYTSVFLHDNTTNYFTMDVKVDRSIPEASLQVQFGGRGARTFVLQQFSVTKL
jgi:hypothetical protein